MERVTIPCNLWKRGYHYGVAVHTEGDATCEFVTERGDGGEQELQDETRKAICRECSPESIWSKKCSTCLSESYYSKNAPSA